MILLNWLLTGFPVLKKTSPRLLSRSLVVSCHQRCSPGLWLFTQFKATLKKRTKELFFLCDFVFICLFEWHSSILWNVTRLHSYLKSQVSFLNTSSFTISLDGCTQCCCMAVLCEKLLTPLFLTQMKAAGLVVHSPEVSAASWGTKAKRLSHDRQH